MTLWYRLRIKRLKQENFDEDFTNTKPSALEHVNVVCVKVTPLQVDVVGPWGKKPGSHSTETDSPWVTFGLLVFTFPFPITVGSVWQVPRIAGQFLKYQKANILKVKLLNKLWQP